MASWKWRSEIFGDVVYFPYEKDLNGGAVAEVYVWDLDKTYLDTSWHTFRDIYRLVFEKSFHKRNIPGTSTLVSCVKKNWMKNGGEKFPLFFITASPPQMENAIREKLQLDQLLPMGLFFKDNLRNIKPGRWGRLTQQVGYKLQALLQLRTRFSGEISQVLWGDDSETDAIIYSLYSDICARRWGSSELEKILKNFHVTRLQMNTIFDLQDQCPEHDPVEKVYINLAIDTDPEYYLKFGRRVVPTFNSFQTGLDLFQDSRIQEEEVINIGNDLRNNYGFSREELQRGLDDLIRRRVLAEETLQRILPLLQEHELIEMDFEPSISPRKVESQVGGRIFGVEGEHEPWIPDHIDYLHDYR